MPYVLYQVLGTRAGGWTSLAHSDNRHLFRNRRSEISKAEWKCDQALGATINILAPDWVAFELVLFSMPSTSSVTSVSMNYASVAFVWLTTMAGLWF